MRTTKVIALSALGLCLSIPAFTAEKSQQASKVEQSRTSDGRVRNSAQRGLDYLVRESTKWTKQHQCYGCHVQAVTLEGLTVGRHHQYEVASRDINTMVGALLKGVTAGGHKTGVAFQGAAWARYDQWIDGEHTDQLLKYGRMLMGYQRDDGSVEDDDRRPPVVAGTLQTTFQAMQTWRQAYARTADEAWLVPMRRAESYLQAQARRWKPSEKISILDLNYALMGLVAASVKRSEPTSQKVQRMLLSRQHPDGSFGLQPDGSDALATGQTLYALKLAGYADRDPVIAKGMRWLIAKQRKNGGWRTVSSSQNGADKGEAMWAVLGLISVDVMSIAVDGLRDGQRVAKSVRINAEAVDNQGSKIRRVELRVDDLPMKTASGSRLAHRLDLSKLPDGKHLVDIIATNAAGKRTSRRFEVFTGHIYMTHIGARFDEQRQRTELSLRNISDLPGGKVRLEVLTVGDKPKRVFQRELTGKRGPMTLSWNGEGKSGKLLPKGRYTARLSYSNGTKKPLQQEEIVFFHDTARIQKEKFGEVQGRVRMKDGIDSANTVVELVDERGQVVQSTRTTDQGNYRFKSVDEGRYKVRIRKRGWGVKEADVQAAPKQAPSTANVEL